jgi:histidine triad (HIT) family protein
VLAARIVYEDEQVLAFEDINPQAPVHVLVIPKRHIVSLNDLEAKDVGIADSLFQAARQVAELKKIHLSGYRTVINTNSNAGQSVFHLHLHVLGGRRMGWPPG